MSAASPAYFWDALKIPCSGLSESLDRPSSTRCSDPSGRAGDREWVTTILQFARRAEAETMSAAWPGYSWDGLKMRRSGFPIRRRSALRQADSLLLDEI